MKTFRDLVFHKNGTGGINSRTDFDNGFSISVIAGGMAYSTPREDKDSPDDFTSFEVAVLLLMVSLHVSFSLRMLIMMFWVGKIEVKSTH